MLGKFFKKKVGIESDSVKQYSNLEVRNGCSISVDTMDFLLNDDYLTMVNPGKDSMRVTDVGITELLGLEAFRFYLKNLDGNEYWLQVVDGDAGQPNSVILFSQIDELYPQSEEDWEQVLEKINGEEFDISQDDEYDLIYTASWDGAVDHDELVEPADGESYSYPLRTALFSRDCKGDGSLTEYLLVAVEEEERVSVYVGIDLNPAGIKVI